MSKKYIYCWFDGDIKRHYFSNKIKFNKWLDEFVEEQMSHLFFLDYYSHLEGKSKKEIKKYFSSSLFLEKIYLDI